jgi:hypothetical protein
MKSMVRNMLTRFAAFTALLLFSLSVQAQGVGIFTTTTITVHDTVFVRTLSFVGCIPDSIQERWISGTLNNHVTAQCQDSTITSGVNPPPYPGGQIVYKTLDINGIVINSPLWTCRVVVDDTLYVPGSPGPSGTRPYNARNIEFRCSST